MFVFYKATRQRVGSKGEIDEGLVITRREISIEDLPQKAYFLNFRNFEIINITLRPDSKTVPNFDKKISFPQALFIIYGKIDQWAQEKKKIIFEKIDEIIEKFRE